MKNLVKRISSMFIVMALLLSIVVPVQAAPAPTISSIQIDNTGNTNTSIDGETFSVYRIYNVTTSSYGTYGYRLPNEFLGLPAYVKTNSTGANSFSNFLGSKAASSQTLMDYITHLKQSDSVGMHAFATIVKNYVSAHSIAPVASKVASGETLMFSISELGNAFGYFLVLGDATAKDGSGDVIGVAGLKTNDDCETFKPKVDAPTLDKKVEDVKDTPRFDGNAGQHTEAETGWRSSTDAEIGEDVKFQIITTIPNMNGYTAYKYTVHDILSKGLTFNGDSTVTVSVLDKAGNPHSKAVGTFNVTSAAHAEGTAITIDFPNILTDWYAMDASDSTKSQWAGFQFVIEYTAKLNQDALVANESPNYNYNKALLEYSNNPYDSSKTNKTPEILVKVYTFEVDVLKFAEVDKVEKYLADATFRLYRTKAQADAAVEAVLKNQPAPDAGAIKVSLEATATDENTYVFNEAGSYDMVTPASGKITVQGLDEGFYYFVETKAPDGFNLLEDCVPVGIDAEYNATTGYLEKLYQWVYVNNAWGWELQGTATTNVADLFASLKIKNLFGDKLPETGGIGRTIFTVAGTGMMLAAAVIMIARKKTSVQQ